MVPIDGLSPQKLSDTIGLIYDCALDTELWPMTLGRLAELVESPYCGLAVQDLVNVEGNCLIDHGYPRAYCELSARYWDQNPMTPSIFLLNVGDVTTLSMTCSDNELFESRYLTPVSSSASERVPVVPRRISSSTEEVRPPDVRRRSPDFAIDKSCCSSVIRISCQRCGN